MSRRPAVLRDQPTNVLPVAEAVRRARAGGPRDRSWAPMNSPGDAPEVVGKMSPAPALPFRAVEDRDVAAALPRREGLPGCGGSSSGWR